jgi:hypothetical protein
MDFIDDLKKQWSMALDFNYFKLCRYSSRVKSASAIFRACSSPT